MDAQVIYSITGHCAGIIINKLRVVNYCEQKVYEAGKGGFLGRAGGVFRIGVSAKNWHSRLFNDSPAESFTKTLLRHLATDKGGDREDDDNNRSAARDTRISKSQNRHKQ